MSYHLAYNQKRVGEVLDFTLDWSSVMEDAEVIISSDWSTSSSVVIDSSGNATQTATVWLSGGTPGTRNEIINTVTTDQGRTFVGCLLMGII